MSSDLRQITAIFASNDQMALGILHGLAERGIDVPDEISVVGFDDLPDSRHFIPPLTTVRQDFAALAALVVRLVVAAVEGDDEAAQHDVIPPSLIVRSSSSLRREF